MNQKRDLVSISELPRSTLLGLLDHAERLQQQPSLLRDALIGRILAVLFFEPSTRTRLSFESAMQRLGGGVLTVADSRTSSAVKGESLHDTVATVSGYADLIALRHPNPGAARLAAASATVPVINAGDGGREHPTQTLTDLATIRQECGSIEGRSVAFFGDLREGRTVHSLARALAGFECTMAFCAERGLELPEPLLASLQREYGLEAGTETLRFGGGRELEAVIVGPRGARAPRAFDVLYATRIQRERLEGVGERLLPRIDLDLVSDGLFSRATILHPLPRTDELAPEIDALPRAAYFRQVRAGVPVRRALILWALGEIDLPSPIPAASEAVETPCSNPRCITAAEAGVVAERLSLASFALCAYCGAPSPA